MTENRIIEGVGRKIVDALKQQSEIGIQNVAKNIAPVEESTFENTKPEYDNDYNNEFNEETSSINDFMEMTDLNSNNYTAPISFNQQQSYKPKETFASELDDYEVPANVVVLKQLINQLPAGVSKQTGAQIIKQTMEALGISMKNVLQEAQQVQENLNNSSKECQTSIVEHKKQIGILERQSQKLQRQSSALNDIISLFVQTNI